MILTKNVILEKINSGEISITPFNPKNVGSGSIDLTLAGEFRIFKKNIRSISINEKIDYKKYTIKIKAKKIKIMPGEMILGITKEKINLADNLCGWLYGRSRFARLGLSVHITAGFVQPGSENKQVMEIVNLAPFPLELHKGDKIMQIIIEETIGRSKFNGKFRNQEL